MRHRLRISPQNNPKHDEPQAGNDHPRPSLALSRININNNDLLTDEGSDDSSYENYQVRLLQDQNRKQANKIKALRQELLEKMHAMHEIKANLFKQEGDPRDKAKIADLSQRLEEKEKITHNLTASMRTLEMSCRLCNARSNTRRLRAMHLHQ